VRVRSSEGYPQGQVELGPHPLDKFKFKR